MVKECDAIVRVSYLLRTKYKRTDRSEFIVIKNANRILRIPSPEYTFIVSI